MSDFLSIITHLPSTYNALLPFCFCLTFLLLIVYGFFESRQNGAYHFRAGRFVTAIIAIFALNLLMIVPFTFLVKDLVTGALPVAKNAVMKNRAAAQYSLDSLGTVFPDLFNDQVRQCYRAGLSNYAEDQWNESFHDGIWKKEEVYCKKHPEICNGKQEDYYEAMRTVANPYHFLFWDFNTIGLFLGSDWVTAAENYNRIRRLYHTPDNKGAFQPVADEKTLSNYQHYLTNCVAFVPLPWAVPGSPILKSETEFCIGRCP